MEPVQIPAEHARAAKVVHQLIRGEHGPWELIWDGRKLTVNTQAASQWATSLVVTAGETLRRFLNAETKLEFGEHGVQFLKPVLGVFASDTLTRGNELVLPKCYIIAPRVTDPIAHKLSADDDGGFTLKLSTRLTGIPLSVRIIA